MPSRPLACRNAVPLSRNHRNAVCGNNSSGAEDQIAALLEFGPLRELHVLRRAHQLRRGLEGEVGRDRLHAELGIKFVRRRHAHGARINVEHHARRAERSVRRFEVDALRHEHGQHLVQLARDGLK
jgi:hypothetical protein